MGLEYFCLELFTKIAHKKAEIYGFQDFLPLQISRISRMSFLARKFLASDFSPRARVRESPPP